MLSIWIICKSLSTLFEPMKYFFFFLICFSFSSFSQEIKEIRIDIKTETGDKKAAIRKAVNQISRDFVETFLGKEKYQGNAEKIKKTILKNQNRYILFSKSSNSIPQNDGKFLTTVTLGISEKNLEGLLLEHNLFYKSHGSLCILPIISFTVDLDEKESYLWWSHESQKSFPESLAKEFFNSLSLHIIKSGFYNADPIFNRFPEALPLFALKGEKKPKGIKSLADFLQCHIVLSGKILLKQNKKNKTLTNYFVFKVFNTQTNQLFFKMRKKFIVPGISPDSKDTRIKKVFSEVSQRILSSVVYQLSIYREKGALDLTRLFLSIQGPLTYFEREALEEALVRHISSIKSLQKRYMSSNKTLYEIKSDKDAGKVADIIRKSTIPNYQVKVTVYNKNRLEIYARTQSTHTTPKTKTLN